VLILEASTLRNVLAPPVRTVHDPFETEDDSDECEVPTLEDVSPQPKQTHPAKRPLFDAELLDVFFL